MALLPRLSRPAISLSALLTLAIVLVLPSQAAAQEPAPSRPEKPSTVLNVLLAGGGFDAVFGPYGGAELVLVRHSGHTFEGGLALGFTAGADGYRASVGASGLLLEHGGRWQASAVSVRAVALRTRMSPRRGSGDSTYVGGELGMTVANIGWSVGYVRRITGGDSSQSGAGGGQFYWTASYAIPFAFETRAR